MFHLLGHSTILAKLKNFAISLTPASNTKSASTFSTTLLPRSNDGVLGAMAAFSCNCIGGEEYDEEMSRNTASTARSTATDGSNESEVLNASYRAVTPLFRNIEKENWEGVLLFLTRGIWSSSILSSSSEHLKSPSPDIQAKTWVTAYDRRGVAEWSQLPLHAAISYSAPFVVVQKLVELYPKGVQCTDKEGMLPIHLAFGFGSSENVLGLLLEIFPGAVNEKGLGGRMPYECCELGPNKVRGKVFKVITDETKKLARENIDHEWREFVNAAKANLKLDFEIDNKQLTVVMYELMQAAKDLQNMKREQLLARKQLLTSPQSAPSPKKKIGGMRKSPGRRFVL